MNYIIHLLCFAIILMLNVLQSMATSEVNSSRESVCARVSNC